MDEGFNVFGLIFLYVVTAALLPIWGPVWMLGALKVFLFGPSPKTPNRDFSSYAPGEL